MIKKGFLNYEAFEYIGKLEIIPLEIPSNVLKKYSEKIYMLDKKDYKDIMPIRKIFGHKGDYGKVVILAGSEGYVGASYLTTYATIKTGSGLVTTIVQDNIKDIFMAKITEGMVIPYSNLNQIEESIRKADVIACGPGLGKTSISEEMFKEIISQSTCLVVIDADGLNFISKDNSLKEYIKGRAIFTPHLGEMARLTGESIEEIKENRIEISKKYAKENNIVLVLKGFNTIITDGEKVYINNTGNSKMASGGMGDTLTGIIASLVGQGLKTLEGALLGCYIHGRAGETASLDRYSVTASEVITEIPKIMEELSIN